MTFHLYYTSATDPAGLAQNHTANQDTGFIVNCIGSGSWNIYVTVCLKNIPQNIVRYLVYLSEGAHDRIIVVH